MRRQYEHWVPNVSTWRVIHQADDICREYEAQGYDLTLRQLYYQFVARGLIENTDRSYKRLGSIVNKARMAGMLDWDFIVDRTRHLSGHSHWDGPGAVLRTAARSFRLDTWTTQPSRVEVWVEKEALAGVVSRAAGVWDVDYFSCRGYVSQSEQWAAAQRLRGYVAAGQSVVILHLGDHDPSGLDMTRDIRDRLSTFIRQDWFDLEPHDLDEPDYENSIDQVDDWEIEMSMEDTTETGDWLTVRRIALNRDQVDEWQPPPNPAKLSDSRAAGYTAEHGFSSWELDALEPSVLDDLIQSHIAGIVDMDRLEERRAEQDRHRGDIETVAARWSELIEGLS